MKRVAVTGGIACGKSLVGEFLLEAGAAVCDTDLVAHGLMARGQPVQKLVVKAFGLEVLAPDGSIDRRVLGQLVFCDAQKLSLLNALVHPAVLDEVRRWMAGLSSACGLAAVVIPLLYEIGGAGSWDAVVCVASPYALQVSRMRDRGLRDEQIRQRLGAQWPVETKMHMADYVLYNSGTKELLKEQTSRVVRRILET